MNTILSDGAKFSIEREFYCPTCKLQRDVCEANQDIVCAACCTIIATFKDRRVIDPKAPRVSLLQEAEKGIVSAQSACAEASAQAWILREPSPDHLAGHNHRLDIGERLGAIVVLLQQIKKDYEADPRIMAIDAERGATD